MEIAGSLRDALIEFVYDETLLLDEKRFEEWYELFTEDGTYWMPLALNQSDGLNQASLMYEDRLLLKLRIDRLKQPRVFSQQPESRCLHVLHRPALYAVENGIYRMRTPMIYTETQGDEQQIFAATVFHDLIVFDDVLKIKVKRVNLLNCDAALPAIQLFI
ncbi:3-phenylpropionate/cinnamic acid dioxygenase small subunit [Caballeronia udeis]|uniref:3-phenylpropionate/cinnamic acid dioxygenase small subunit n=1 Tax=Caballeronia udeis TaxID=1232866 RepID=A0ABW8MQY8_9BURK